MTDGRQGRGTVAILGAAAVAVVLTLFGVLRWETAKPAMDGSPAEKSLAEQGGPPEQGTPASTDPGAAAKPRQTAQGALPQPKKPQPGKDQPAAPAKAAAANDGAKDPKDPKQAGEALAPSFDIVRVEPNGDSVIAGRAAPGATIELLRDNHVHARGVADASGLFAITPPALPTGSHQIALQSIAPDGTRQRSREIVTVAINGNTPPLVALTAPDKPTVLLSSPEPPASKAAQAKSDTAKSDTAKSDGSKSDTAKSGGGAPSQPAAADQVASSATPPAGPSAPTADEAGQPTARPEIKIVTVEAEQGKLYVSGQAAPGATVRLYLNETFVAPGGAGGDGRLSFAIGSGVKPGDYRVRLDDVDPVSGQVKSRAEVAFNVPPDAAPSQMVQGTPRPMVAAPAPVAQPPAADAAAAGNQVASALPEAQMPVNTIVVPNIETAIVSKGDSLWRISQRIYGRGMRYTVIYGANQQQIRDPDLIYPGQVFVLPADKAQPKG